jgi:hypothetical protein
VTSDEARVRLGALGFDDEVVATLIAHFEDADGRGKAGHGLSRIAWLESLDLDPAARPRRILSE